jgi:predicted ATPase/class 3 adenylate cyclase
VDIAGSTLTFLFSDLEGSTRLWERHPDAMQAALARHDLLLGEAVEQAGGQVVKSTGDGIMAVFRAPRDAVAASIAAQRSLGAEAWGETGPLRVRMGIHLGEAQARGGDWFGSTVNRTARVMAAAHGGQVLLSAAAAATVTGALPAEVALRDLGSHRLKDLEGPEQLFQVVADGLPESFPPLATLDARPNNLPTQTTAFLGRESVLDEIRELLDADDVRLVTLTGPGGTGKTRLGLQAAAEQVDRFDDGVFFVDLSAEREPDAVFAAIARSVATGASGEDSPLEALARRLGDAQMLLLLDNFEQVTVAAPDLVTLLQRCPRLKALVTSREALRVRGERQFPVPPLSLPRPEDGVVTVEAALASEAVHLFADRAAGTRPHFVVTEDNVADVVAICARLDGLPLAIELAAARINLFAVDELRERLDDRLDVLASGARDLPERQRTLRSTIEWSNELLSDEERRVLRMFAVFVGARLTDVEATIRRLPDPGDVDVVGALGSLVDKSLVRSVVDTDGRPRFSMLQTVRAYATEQLDADPAGLARTMRRAHAEHYTDRATTLRRALADTDREQVLAALGDELGNLRAAWTHWVDAGDVPRLNELLEPLWGYYDARGQYGAAVELGNDLLRVLAIQPETPERVRDEIALEMSLARSLITVRGYDAEVERSIRAALERSGAADDAPERFPVLRSLATLHMLRADYSSGAELGRELLTIAEQQQNPMLLSDAHLVVGLNTAFGTGLSEGLGHLDTSIDYFDAAKPGLVKFRVGPIPGVVANIVSGLILWMLGFPDRAVSRVGRALELALELGHPYSHAYALYHSALLDLWRHEPQHVAERADELMRVANANDYPIWRALALVLRGTARIGSGEADAGLAEVERGFLLYEGMSTPPVFWPALLMIRATACAMAGHLDKALGYLDDADAELPDGDFQASDVAIIRSDVLLAHSPQDRARAVAELEGALAMAEQAGLRMNALMATTRLARLRRGTEAEADALQALRAVLDSFTEGHTTPQVAEARAILGLD